MGGIDVVVSVATFGLGLLVGWLWWGRRFVVARLTREQAESLAEARLERETAAREAAAAPSVIDLREAHETPERAQRPGA
ncbi:hypothetical protein [Aquipuribacter nitratireducens]|uniref:Uncharacterized protein n=1 Tax=Aquipuribacter nitratireducens TaxID=650104 RepID=A0ABW0GJB1_9MICO